jgi:hypothetical protein
MGKRLPFDDDAARTYVEILKKMVEAPPSDRVMDAGLVKLFGDFCSAGDFSPVAVWNHYMKALDFTVRYAWGSSFIIKLLDIEPFYDAPTGGYAQRDHSIDSAPWRNDPTI